MLNCRFFEYLLQNYLFIMDDMREPSCHPSVTTSSRRVTGWCGGDIRPKLFEDLVGNYY